MKDGLTASYVRDLLHYNPSTGDFFWLVDRNRARSGNAAGTLNVVSRYTLISIDGVQYPAHRLAWLYVMGTWPDGEVDHKNGKRSDNSFKNLRVVTHKINSQNRRSPRKGSKSGLLGVSRSGGRGRPWMSAIIHEGKRHYLGTFDTPEEAHAVYVDKKRELHEGCTL